MSLLLTGRPGKGFREAAFFRPRSVWLRADPDLPESAVLARNLAAGDFKGSLMGDGFAALESAPDLAILCVRPEAQAAELARIAAAGCFAVVVPTAAPGLASMAAEAGVHALGERSFGLALPDIGLNATLSHLPLRPGKLALMAQSSAIARAVIDWAAAEGLGFSHIIGVGSNDGTGFAAGLDWLARDTGTACVMLDIRRIKQRRFFVSAARAVARTRPVLALRAGGRMDDPSGIADGVMAAVLRRAGVLRADGFEEWLAAAETLARTKPRGGSGPGAGKADRIAILANGLGVARLATDAALAQGLRLAEFSPATQAALAPLIPEGWRVRNPLSLGSRAGAGLAQAARLLAAADEVDVVIALHAPEQEAAPTEAFAAAASGNRGAPILLGWTGEASARAERAALTQAGLPVFQTPEAVVRGAAHLAAERRNRATAAELPASDVLEITPDRAAVRAIFAAARADGRLDLYEDEALAVLAAYGIAILRPRLCETPTEAAVAAVAIGPPVALKARALLRHKSEVGGVVLNLRHFDSVRAAADVMAEEVRRRAPGVTLAGFLVQPMARREAVELRLRIGEDAMFGPWIGFGQGGTTADIAADEALDLPPLNLPLAHGLIARTRLARLLPGFRDRPAVNEPAIADALVRIGQLQVDFPEIAGIGVNPLFADASGVLAADASIRLRAAGEVALFAIPPYPAEWVAPFAARDGSVFEVRPIRPEDAAAQGAFFLELPAEDVRFRFFSTMKELPPAMLARLTQIDYGREMAFIATRDGRNFGTARVIREGGGPSAEFAVVVSPAAKGIGLARHLMERAMEWARAEGVTEIVGHVLADNAPMQGFMRKLGFTLSRSLEDTDMMLAKKLL